MYVDYHNIVLLISLDINVDCHNIVLLISYDMYVESVK